MAYGSLGTLSIDVLANIAGLVSDMGRAQAEGAKAAREFQNQWTEANARIEESFRTLAEVVGVGFGIEKIAEFTKSVVEAGLQIYDLSLKTGISAQTLSSYSVAAAEAGVSIDVFGNALAKMARSANDASHGSEAQASAFKQLGVSVTDAAGHLKGADQVLGEVAQGLDKLQDGLGKTAIVTEIFGRGGATLIPLLSDLGEGVDAAREKAIAFGLAINDTQAKALKAFDVTVTDAGLAIRGAFTQALIEVLPSLQHAAEQILDFVQHSQGIKDVVNGAASAIEFLATHLEGITTLLKDLAELAAASFFLRMGEQALTFAKGLATASTSALTLKTALAEIVPLIAAAQAGTAIGNWANQFDIVREAAAAFVGAIVLGWDKIKEAAQITFAAIAVAWDTVISGIRSGVAALAESLASALGNVPGQAQNVSMLQTYATSLRDANDAIKTFAQRKAEIVAASDKEYASDKEIVNAMIDYAASGSHAGAVLKDFTVSSNEAKIATDGFDKKLGAAKENFVALAAELVHWNEENDKLSGGLDAVTKAQADFSAEMLKSAQELVVMIGHGLSMADAMDLLAKRTDLATDAMNRSIAADYVKFDKYDTYIQKLKDQEAATEALTFAQKSSAEFDKIAAENALTLHDAYGELHGSMAKVITANAGLKDGFIATASAIEQHTQNVKLDQEVIKQWQTVATNAFDSAFSAINKDIVEGGSVMKDLENVAKQVVEAILMQFERLAIINPLLNQIFGLSGTSGELPTSNILGSLFGGGSGGGIGNLLGLALGGSGTAIAGGSSILLGTGGATDALGVGDIPQTFNSTLPSSVGGAATGYGAGIPGFGNGFSGLSLIGGAFAGYNEFQNAGGGLAGLAGGAAYGIGTAAIGTAVGAGIAAAATGGISAGLAAGFAAVPVVGWIALAAMVLDKVTGGGLFGTAAKPIGSELNIDIGQDSATASAAIDEKGKKSLFRGSYWKSVPTAVDQATQDSLAQFYSGLSAEAAAEADAYKQATASVVQGSFHETFDKAGKMLTQESTILGQKFSESIQDFQTREMADTLLANMGDASAAAQAIAEQWQQSANDLLAGAEFLSQAQLDINNGNALVQGDTLAQLTKFVQGMQAQDETLIQTYGRLSAETTVFAGAASQLGITLSATGEALVKMSDDATAAAGGIQNLQTLLNDYYGNYFSDSERAAAKLKNDKAASDAALSAIGQDPNETMQQFRDNFTAIAGSLNGADFVKWLQAAELLKAYSQDIGATNTDVQKAADSYQQFVDQFKPVTTDVGVLTGALNALGAGIAANIDQANKLAVAAGMQGASAEDVANILIASANAGAAAIRQFEAQAQQLATSLYGSSVDQLQTKLDAVNAKIAQNDQNSYAYADQAKSLQAQIDTAKASQEQAQRLSDATTLLADLGQIGQVTGSSLDDLAKSMGIPLDKLASDLGITPDQLNQQFTQQEAIAQAALDSVAVGKEQVEYLADIRALLANQPLPYSGEDLQNAASGATASAGNPFVPKQTTATSTTSADVKASIDKGNAQSDSAMESQTDVLVDIRDGIKQLLQALGSGQGRNAPVPVPRSLLGRPTYTR